MATNYNFGGRIFARVLVPAAIVLLLLALTGCVGRLSLVSYLENLDAIRSRTDTAFAQVKSMIQSGGNPKSPAGSFDRGAKNAQKVLSSALAALSKLEPPAQAKKLHRLVTDLYADSKDFFAEVRSMLAYAAARSPFTAQVQAAAKELDTALAANAAPAAIAQALSATADKVAGALGSLQKLKAPAVLSAVHNSLVGMLADYLSSLRSLASAVAKGDSAAVNAAQAKMKEALQGNMASQTQKSIDAYNAGIDKIDKLRRQANAEESRITATPNT
jgi:hypothetical protein